MFLISLEYKVALTFSFFYRFLLMQIDPLPLRRNVCLTLSNKCFPGTVWVSVYFLLYGLTWSIFRVDKLGQDVKRVAAQVEHPDVDHVEEWATKIKRWIKVCV